MSDYSSQECLTDRDADGAIVGASTIAHDLTEPT